MAPSNSALLKSISAVVMTGASNAEVMAAHPTVRPGTIESYAALARKRLGIPKRSLGAIGPVIFADVMRGLSTPDLVAAYPHLKPNSIRASASRIRAEHGVHRGYFERQPLKIPQELASALTNEAVARGGYKSGNALTLRMLAIIVRDNLFDAVLDDGA